MRPRRSVFLSGVTLSLLALLAGGCASEGTTSGQRQSLPGALAARWTPPEFATRSVDGERSAVLDACVATANAMGFSVSRLDGASGKLSASRRQKAPFDGAREETLEVTVSSFAPTAVQVSVVLREAEESADGMVSGGLVRERAPYDAFFERLGAALRPADAPAPVDAPAPAAPTAS